MKFYTRHDMFLAYKQGLTDFVQGTAQYNLFESFRTFIGNFEGELSENERLTNERINEGVLRTFRNFGGVQGE